MDPLRRRAGTTRQEVIDASGFRRGFGRADGAITDTGWQRVREPITTAFATPEWTPRVP